jgi:hypothetical protein
LDFRGIYLFDFFYLKEFIQHSAFDLNDRLCAAPVGTIAHWASLSIYSSSLIPGEKPKLVDVKEQRVTNLLVHIAIGTGPFYISSL